MKSGNLQDFRDAGACHAPLVTAKKVCCSRATPRNAGRLTKGTPLVAGRLPRHLLLQRQTSTKSVSEAHSAAQQSQNRSLPASAKLKRRRAAQMHRGTTPAHCPHSPLRCYSHSTGARGFALPTTVLIQDVRDFEELAPALSLLNQPKQGTWPAVRFKPYSLRATLQVYMIARLGT
jgi:hypothetical protein